MIIKGAVIWIGTLAAGCNARTFLLSEYLFQVLYLFFHCTHQGSDLIGDIFRFHQLIRIDVSVTHILIVKMHEKCLAYRISRSFKAVALDCNVGYMLSFNFCSTFDLVQVT